MTNTERHDSANLIAGIHAVAELRGKNYVESSSYAQIDTVNWYDRPDSVGEVAECVRFFNEQVRVLCLPEYDES